MKRRILIRKATQVLRLPQIRALRKADQEHNYVIGLDSSLAVLCIHLAAVGTVDLCHSHARDVFRELIRHNCSQFIFVHNHPGGGPPSAGDQDVTDWLRKAGNWLGIPLVAHVLVPGESEDPRDVGEPMDILEPRRRRAKA